MKTTTVVILLIIVAISMAFFMFQRRRHERFFSRDFAYGKANSVMWNRYLKKASKSIAKENADIRNLYKFPGTGDYIGMMCRERNNVGCTTYNTLGY